MSWLSIDVYCSNCDEQMDAIIPRDQVPEVGAVWEQGNCRRCSGEVVRVVSRPNHTKASFVDGTRRFDQLRTQDRLDAALSEARTTDDKKKIIVEKDKLNHK